MNFSKETTIEQDLIRRDLTINSIAYDSQEDLYIDPYGGIEDIKNRIIRHTSEAFRDDPLRVLRTARFAAKMHSMGFKIHLATFYLMQDMVASGELDYLTPERVWAETLKALDTKNPEVYFCVLLYVGALKVIFQNFMLCMGFLSQNSIIQKLILFAYFNVLKKSIGIRIIINGKICCFST